MFILKSKLKEYKKKLYKQGYDKGISDGEEERKQIIKEKNRVIKKHEKNLNKYIEKSFRLNECESDIEELKNTLLVDYNRTIAKCDKILHRIDMNKSFILNNEAKLRSVK